MDFLGSMINERGCNVDGSTSSNPIINAVDHMLQSMPMGGGFQTMNDGSEGGVLQERSMQQDSFHNRFAPQGHPNPHWMQEFARYQPNSMEMEHEQMNSAWMMSQNEMSMTPMQMPMMPMSMAPNQAMAMQMNMNMMQSYQPFHSSGFFPPMQMSMPYHQDMQQRNVSFSTHHTNVIEDQAINNTDMVQGENVKHAHTPVTSTESKFLQEMQVHTERDLSAELQQAWTEGGIEQVEARLKSMWEEQSAGDAQDVHLSSVMQEIQENKQTVVDMESVKQDAPSRASLELAWNDVLKTLESDQFQYPFSQDNAYTDDNDAFEKGVELFRAGRVPDAIMAFESVLSKDGDYSEAWSRLGACHAENDDDKKAIACLQRARDCDAYNLDALLALGTSYVNEMDSLGALDALRSWVTHHPKFHGIQIQVDEYSDGSLMDEVTQLMLTALSWAPEDPDVLVLLGVLYNVSQNYDSAVMSFEKALQSQPDDYSLWNKIGATLANGGKSAEAVQWYAKALESRPGYVRGWLNLGISYSNLSQLEDAARSYLQALKLNPRVSHIWIYLKTTFKNMNRHDLADNCEEGADVGELLRQLDM
mmetsp:Transcript_40472/g.41289  ORF Transcript_40472/g.41289 Transcript_40472/m.41289 type:complete len:589 (+) Transcript_40472:188-1954(+)